MSDELDACPYCEKDGGSVKKSTLSYWVECKFCGYNIGFQYTRGKAIKVWNRRPRRGA